MKEDNKDILDLCRLNLMEEHIEKAVAPDRDATLMGIDWARRRLAQKIINKANKE